MAETDRANRAGVSEDGIEGMTVGDNVGDDAADLFHAAGIRIGRSGDGGCVVGGRQPTTTIVRQALQARIQPAGEQIAQRRAGAGALRQTAGAGCHVKQAAAVFHFAAGTFGAKQPQDRGDGRRKP